MTDDTPILDVIAKALRPHTTKIWAKDHAPIFLAALRDAGYDVVRRRSDAELLERVEEEV